MKKKTKALKQDLLDTAVTIPDNAVYLSRGIRVFIFILFIIHSIIVDIDNGVISSSAIVIRKDLNMKNSEYGLFASIPFIGRIVGLLLFMGIIERNHRKLMIITTICLHGGSFFLYSIISNKWALLCLRLFTASMKVFSSIYMPVWIDQFGLRNHKTIMLTISYMTSPYGQVVGFALGTIVFPDNWRYSLYTIGSILSIIGLFFLFIPVKYFSKRYMFIGYEEEERLVPTKSKFTSNSLYGQVDPYDTTAVTSIKRENPKWITLITSGSFIFCSLTRAIFFFIFQIIHLFIKQYAINGLEIYDHNKILYFYSITCILGPGLGSFIGGVLSTKLGGYECSKSIIIPITFGLINCGLIIPLAYCSDMMMFSITMFAYFFSSAAILPSISGFLIYSIPKELKGFGTSLELLISTLLGKLPGPIIYGFINDKYQMTNPRMAWQICMFYYYIGFIVLVSACICQRRRIFLQESDDTFVKKPFKRIRGEDYAADLIGDKKDLMKIHKPIPDYNRHKCSAEIQMKLKI